MLIKNSCILTSETMGTNNWFAFINFPIFSWQKVQKCLDCRSNCHEVSVCIKRLYQLLGCQVSLGKPISALAMLRPPLTSTHLVSFLLPTSRKSGEKVIKCWCSFSYLISLFLNLGWAELRAAVRRKREAGTMLIPSWKTALWRPQHICLPCHSRLWKIVIPRFKFGGSCVV